MTEAEKYHLRSRLPSIYNDDAWVTMPMAGRMRIFDHYVAKAAGTNSPPHSNTLPLNFSLQPFPIMPNNNQRANRAAKALKAFRGKEAKDESDLTDLLCNLMHLAHRDGLDFDRQLIRAQCNFQAEQIGQYEVPIVYKGQANYTVTAESPEAAEEIAANLFRRGVRPVHADDIAYESIENIGDVTPL